MLILLFIGLCHLGLASQLSRPAMLDGIYVQTNGVGLRPLRAARLRISDGRLQVHFWKDGFVRGIDERDLHACRVSTDDQSITIVSPEIGRRAEVLLDLAPPGRIPELCGSLSIEVDGRSILRRAGNLHLLDHSLEIHNANQYGPLSFRRFQDGAYDWPRKLSKCEVALLSLRD